MSNLLINIRVLFWHFQLTTDGDWSVSYNEYWCSSKVFGTPIAIYEWEIRRKPKYVPLDERGSND